MRSVVALVVILVLGCTEPGQRTTAPDTIAPTTAEPTTAPLATAPSLPTTAQAEPKPLDPATVVRRFYAAINNGDYKTAWALGGKNLGNRSYQAFAAGFADTDHDELRVTAVRGQLVDVRLVATQDGGTRQTVYAGTYRVVGGQITRGRLHVASQTGGAPAGACDTAYPDFCIPPPPPDLDCSDIDTGGFTVLPPDPHRFDADHDGVGCER
ncbi:MAG TPA: hypothetical protein VF486_01305 [Actinomycetes bacterium]